MRILAAGKEGSGKTMFILSAAKLGPLAVADPEFGMHNYLMPHPNGEEKVFTLIDRTKKMLGFAADAYPVIKWVQTNDLAKVRSFMEKASKDPAIVTLAIDSASILWDIASSTVEGRQDWNKAKQPLRLLQYLVMSSGKHYIFTAHLNPQFNEDMTKVIGELPWSEKKDPHWGDLNLKFVATGGAPVAIVLKERSSGLYKRGDKIEAPSLEGILKRWLPPPIVGKPLPPSEETYQVDVAGRKEME